MTLYQIDAFTDHAFGGNPAGVTILNQELGPKQMQNIAKEMNLSETAFVWPHKEGWNIKWFSPTMEIDLCGHATLATAHIMRQLGLAKTGDELVFHSKSGILKALLLEKKIRLDFPAQAMHEVPLPPTLAASFDVKILSFYSNGIDCLVELQSPQIVENLRPDMQLIESLPYRGLMITAKGGPDGADFVSRFFGPAVGIPEDPVTGSAHCALTPFWAQRLGKSRLKAVQLSSRRGELVTENRGERVWIEGEAVTVFEIQMSDGFLTV